MTAAEYRRLVAAGKLTPASTQKRKATKRRALEAQATTTTPGGAGLALVRIEIQYADGCVVVHNVNPELTEIIETLKKVRDEK